MKITIITLILIAFAYCDRKDDDAETCFSYLDEVERVSVATLESMDIVMLTYAKKFLSASESEQIKQKNDFMKNCMIGAVHYHFRMGRISEDMAEGLLITIEQDY